MSVIRISDLVVRYGQKTAVDHLSLSVEEGEVLVMLGRNGAGKTSAIEASEGLRARQGGDIAILGHDPWRDRTELSQQVGVMLQDGGTYPMLSPKRSLTLEASYYATATPVDELLDRLSLQEVSATSSKRLSGGERRRLSLALALAGSPRVLFLDEPTAGVDVHGRSVIRTLIRDLSKAGTTIVVSTHELDEAERIADRIAVIERGQLLRFGTLDELTGKRESTRVRGSANVDLASFGNQVGSRVVELEAGIYRIDRPPDPDLIAKVGEYFSSLALNLVEVAPERSNLTDVYLSLTQDNAEESEG